MSKVINALRSLNSVDVSPVLASLTMAASHAVIAWGASAPVVVALSNPPIW